MNGVKHNVRAVLLGIAAAAALATATMTIASADTTVPVRREHVMTDPCARVMNIPKRALVAYHQVTPPSEKGLQCPIENTPSSDDGGYR